MKTKKIIALALMLVMLATFATALGATPMPRSFIIVIGDKQVEFPVSALADADMGAQFIAWLEKAASDNTAKVYVRSWLTDTDTGVILDENVQEIAFADEGATDLKAQINNPENMPVTKEVVDPEKTIIAKGVVGGKLIVEDQAAPADEKVKEFDAPGGTPTVVNPAVKELVDLKNKIKALVETDYTDGSWALAQAALADALALTEENETEIADKNAAIKAALALLVKIEEPGTEPTITHPAFGTAFYMNETTDGAPAYDGFGNYWLVFPYTVGNTDIVITGYSVTNGTNTATVEGLNFPKTKETSGFVYVDASDLGLADDNAAIPAGSYTATITYNIGTETGKTVSSTALVVAKALEVPAPADPVYSIKYIAGTKPNYTLNLMYGDEPVAKQAVLWFFDAESSDPWWCYVQIDATGVKTLIEGAEEYIKDGAKFILIIDEDITSSTHPIIVDLDTTDAGGVANYIDSVEEVEGKVYIYDLSIPS